MSNISYIQIIRKCNQNCLFCSNPENFKEMSFSEVKKQIDHYISEGMREVILTGGEPTLNEDLLQIIKYAKDNGLEVRIITNGQKLADKIYLKSLLKVGLEKIHLSFYSYLAKIQNYLSQNKDSYRNLIKALNNLRDYNLAVTINTVTNKFNAKHLDKNVIFLLNNYPYIKHFVFNNCDPYMNRASANKHVIPRLQDFKKSLHKALKILILAKKTFRVEKVPLCYMLEFAQYSTETRKLVKKEDRTIYFLDNRGLDKQGFNQFKYNSLPICQNCSLLNICAGLHGAFKYFDPAELIPQSIDPKIIVDKIIKNKTE